MKIAIIDDEKRWVTHTKKFVLNHYKTATAKVDCYLSGINFMNELKQYDVVIMDLEMPDQDGFKTISEYKKIYPKSIILILTSHMELVQNGYLVNAFRYLNKANLSDELEAALTAIDNLNEQNKTIPIHILNMGEQHIIVSDILFFETEKRNLRIHTTHGTFICTDTISHIEKMLPSKGFFRSHKSFIVNLNMVRSYDNIYIIMVNNEKAMVSLRRYPEFKRQYLKWQFENACC